MSCVLSQINMQEHHSSNKTTAGAVLTAGAVFQALALVPVVTEYVRRCYTAGDRATATTVSRPIDNQTHK